MGTNQEETTLEELEQEFISIMNSRADLVEEISDWSNLSDERRKEISRQQYRLRDDAYAVLNRIKQYRPSYKRPNGRIMRFFTKRLGPLPRNMSDAQIDHDANLVMAALPTYRLPAFGLLAVVLSTIIGLSWLFPQLLISPVTLVTGAMSVDQSTTSGVTTSIIVLIAVIFLVFSIVKRKATRRFVDIAAHEEEKCFRSGAENWSTRQRVISCVLFGFCHVVNLIYPLVTLIALTAAGAAFMAVYLAEFRRSNDVHRATLASTKMHAQYNIYALHYVLAIVALVTIISFL